MIQKWVFGVLFLSLVLVACSPSEEVTGNAVVDSQASLLQVHVIDEDGEIVDGASIYVNNVLKGKTSKYGENKGSKIVILKGERNSITVEKEGFFLSKPISVSASAAGEQRMTIVLEQEQAEVLVKVQDIDGNGLENATVQLLSPDPFIIPQDAITNKDGLVTFRRVSDGTYMVTAALAKHENQSKEVTINFSSGQEQDVAILLERLPHLQVTVMDESGNALEGAEVTLYTKSGFNTPGDFPLHINLTDGEGIVDYEDAILDETYVVIIKKAGFNAQTFEKRFTIDDQFLAVEMSLGRDDQVEDNSEESVDSTVE